MEQGGFLGQTTGKETSKSVIQPYQFYQVYFQLLPVRTSYYQLLPNGAGRISGTNCRERNFKGRDKQNSFNQLQNQLGQGYIAS